MKQKRILSLLTALVLCLSLLFPASAAETAPQDEPDNITILKALGIIKNYGDQGYIPYYAITRGETAVLVCNLLNIDSGVAAGAELTEEWAEPAMRKLSEMNIMSGSAQEEIIYQDFVTVLVRAMGYETLAAKRGGYPVGYFTVAAQAGVTDGVSLSGGDTVSKGVAARLVYNAAVGDMLVQTGYGAMEKYETQPGRTLLSEYHSIYRIDSRVTGTEAGRLSKLEGCRRGTAELDGEEYLLDTDTAGSLLGYDVTAFYRQEPGNGERTLVYVYPRRGHNAATVIEADDLLSYEGFAYAYLTDTGRKEHIAVSPKADIIFNGKPAFSMEQWQYLPDAGRVEIVSTSGGGDADLLVITSYETWVVQFFNQNTATLYDKYTQKSLVLDEKDRDYLITLKDTEGKAIKPASLKEMDVVTVQASADRKMVTGTVTRRTVSGMVTERSEVGKKVYVSLDGTPYEVLKSYIEHGDVSLTAGTSVKAYLDLDGKIAAVTAQGGVLEFGYLAKTALSGGIGDELMLKIFTQKGAFVQLTCAQTVRVDGMNLKTGRGILERITANNGGEARMLIQYQTNKEGLVNRIDTPYFDAANETEETLKLSHPVQSLNYKNSSKIFGNKVAIDGGTIVFNVPKTGDSDDEDLYEIKSTGYFANDNSYSIECYTNRETYGAVQVVLLYDQSSGISIDKNSGVAVVESKGFASDPETGDTLGQLTCYGQDGGTYYVAAEIDLSGILPGDIIRFSARNRTIRAISKLYDYASGTRTQASDPGGSETMLGYVAYKTTPYIQVSAANPAEGGIDPSALKVYKADSFSIFLFDGTRPEPTVKAASAADLLDYQHAGADCSKVFVITRNADARSIIILK